MPSKSIAGLPPNNSFKPSPLRGLGAGSYDSAIAVAATLPGLTQALGGTVISSEREVLREQWRKIAAELNILFLAPYELALPNGTTHEFVGLLPQFGGSGGMLIDVQHSSMAFDTATQAGFGSTSMLPELDHSPVNPSDYIDCLHDWGWIGPGVPPDWYSSAA